MKILVLENHEDLLPIIQRNFGATAEAIDRIRHMDQLLDAFQENGYDVLVWQMHSSALTQHAAMDLLEVITHDFPTTQVIAVADPDDPEMAAASIAAGGFQYMMAPINESELVGLVTLAHEQRPVLVESDNQAESAEEILTEFEGIVGSSPAMQQVYLQIQQAALTDVSVLITGPTGAGKDMVASALHRQSNRKNKPFISVNTGAMPPELIASELFGHERGAFTGALSQRAGKFEDANRGTIFLDEIGTMDHKVQISLLRLLEQRTLQRLGGSEPIEVDVRVVAATNENLQQAIDAGEFREDLFYRFDVFRIDVPPLQERGADILLLAEHFLARFANQYNKRITAIDTNAQDALLHYPWPGNVRELRNTMQRAALLCPGPDLQLDQLPLRFRQHSPNNHIAEMAGIAAVGMTLQEAEKALILHTLAHCQGNKSKAAKMLGISRPALYQKLRK